MHIVCVGGTKSMLVDRSTSPLVHGDSPCFSSRYDKALSLAPVLVSKSNGSRAKSRPRGVGEGGRLISP